MSSYRDDLIDIITIKTDTLSNLIMMMSERITTHEQLGTTNKDKSDDDIFVSDELTDGVTAVCEDAVLLRVAIQDKKIRREMVSDVCFIQERAYRIYRDHLSDDIATHDAIMQQLTTKDKLSENMGIQDGNAHNITDNLRDNIGIAAVMDNQRYIVEDVADTTALKDNLSHRWQDKMSDVLTIGDDVRGKHNKLAHLISRIHITDNVKGVLIQPLDDTIGIADDITDKLIAKNTLYERAMVAVMDSIIHDGSSMAWTMNTVNQALSQYTSYDIERVAVVNGVLHGEGKDGVYRLDGVDETITGVVVTDNIDYGENLVKPAYAYTEYRTDGIMSLAVHTTQKGTVQSYAYHLPKEQADEMTNGRFVFGRGLYGRQFAYTLTVQAKFAHLHDLNIHFETTTRRL